MVTVSKQVISVLLFIAIITSLFAYLNRSSTCNISPNKYNVWPSAEKRRNPDACPHNRKDSFVDNNGQVFHITETNLIVPCEHKNDNRY
jgi:hypothetical protein